MNRYKKMIIAASLTVGMGTGAILFTPSNMDASGNVVLASVDWVKSQLSPLNSKIASTTTKVSTLETKVSTLETTVTSLETKLNTQQKQIDSLKDQVSKLTPPPVTTPTVPTSATLPSIVYVAKSSVTVHSGAAKTYKVVATKSINSSLKVIGSYKASTGLWYKVQVTTTVTGWIFSGDISTVKVATTLPTKVIATAEVHLRKGASTSYSIAATLPKGTVTKYLSTFKNAKGETWYNVLTTTGIKGWVFSGLSEVK